MGKKGRTSTSKRLEALVRAQKMNELLQIGGIQSQALLDSAGETRPSDESHVVELLENEKFSGSEIASSRSGRKSNPAKTSKKAGKAKKASSKKGKRK